MLDSSDVADAAGAAPMCVDELRGWRARLTGALERPDTGLDDTERIDAIRALEELVCAATAAQAALSAELAESRRRVDADAGVPAARQGRGTAALVAHARRESPRRGSRHLGLARIMTTELPATWRAWAGGHISEWTATLIARETACLSLEHRAIVDATIASDTNRVAAMGTRQLVAALRTEAERLDVAACVKRRRRAETERHVSLRPAPDTMTWFSALLPVKDGVALYATLAAAADAARATGDPRTRGQVTADELVLRVTRTSSPTDSVQAPAPVELGLVMSDQALFGDSEEPAHLDGYGPIPAELAREILAASLDSDTHVWLRRLYTHPATGELMTTDTRRRRFHPGLARFIRLRDRTCRTPWCDAPIRHIDHAVPWAQGGPTTLTNGQGLCEACNHAKQAIGWHARPTPDGAITTTLPTGHTYTTRPPPLIRIIEQPAVRIDYCLAG